MRESELWRRLELALGSSYVTSWAQTQAITQLGGLTVCEALAARVPFKKIWLACWEYLELPLQER
ncbi:MAG: DUF3046 domain-containing protein [Propionibacteriaceae bacterium]